MQRNIVIFLIIILLFLIIALVGYLIFVLQDRMGIARRGDTESEISGTSHVT
jgi:uncharacterized membrane protein